MIHFQSGLFPEQCPSFYLAFGSNVLDSLFVKILTNVSPES